MRKDLGIEDLIRMNLFQDFIHCPLTGKVLKTGYGHKQWAHYLCNTKTHRTVFGDEIIDSQFNGIFVEGLEANNAVQLNSKSKPGSSKILAEWIIKKETGYNCRFCLEWL